MISALIITIVTEIIITYILTKSKEWAKYNLFCNMLTNPLLNMSLLGFSILGRNIETMANKMILTYYLPLLVLEILVIWAEGYLYGLMSEYPAKMCYRVSVITNGVSIVAGLLFNMFINAVL